MGASSHPLKDLLPPLKVGLHLKFDYKLQFLFLEKSETSGIDESHGVSF